MSRLFIDDLVNQSGNVEITQYINGKKCKTFSVKNNSTILMCEYLTRALAGESIVERKPCMIVPCKRDSDGNLVNMFSFPISSTSYSTPKDGDNYSQLKILFILQSALLPKGKVIDGFRLFRPGKLSDIGDDYDNLYKFAEVDLGEQKINITGDTNLEVNWILKVSYEK